MDFVGFIHAWFFRCLLGLLCYGYGRRVSYLCLTLSHIWIFPVALTVSSLFLLLSHYTISYCSNIGCIIFIDLQLHLDYFTPAWCFLIFRFPYCIYILFTLPTSFLLPTFYNITRCSIFIVLQLHPKIFVIDKGSHFVQLCLAYHQIYTVKLLGKRK